MLLTLAPLGGGSTSMISIFVQALQLPSNQWAASFDLHVLGMPPAFILSQDQTLNKKNFYQVCSIFPSYSKLTFCLVFKDHLLLFWRAALTLYQIIIVKSTLFLNFFKVFLQWFVHYFTQPVFLNILIIYIHSWKNLLLKFAFKFYTFFRKLLH